MASEAERHLRGLAVARLRSILPGARIVHELNVETGRCRVDLAAIGTSALYLVEIKSRKDKLDRLPEQVRTFAPACTGLAVLYSAERWDWNAMRSAGVGWEAQLWADDKPQYWEFRNNPYCPPNASAMLNLLWRDELFDASVRAGFQPHKRDSRSPMMNRLWAGLTGKELVEAVCFQLRRRPFAEGDPPIL